MAAPTLLVDAGVSLLTAILYAYVGRVAIRRRVAGDGHLAAVLFGVFWYALACLQALTGLGLALAWAGIMELAVHVTITHAAIFVLCAALWALDYYLFYLMLGTRRLLAPLTAFAVAFYALALYVVVAAHPIGVVTDEWRTSLVYETPLTGSPLVVGLMLLLIVPPIIGALAYMRLFFKVEDTSQRYRIGLVSVTLAAWFGSTLLAWAIEINTLAWWPIASRGIALVAAVLIFLAYRPPGWVRRKWGIAALDEAAPA